MSFQHATSRLSANQPRFVIQPWPQWQLEIVALLKEDFEQTLGCISIEDVDWLSWRPFYEQGRSPRSAIERALERDI